MKLFFPAFLGLLMLGLTPIQAQTDSGVTDKEIVLGSSLPLTGGFSFVGQQTKIGLETCFSAFNQSGGVNGRQIRLVTYDDGYEPVPCVKNTQALIGQDHVFALCSYVGTPTSVKAQSVWQSAKIPAVGFYSGAKLLREPFNRYNVHVRASYGKEVAAALDGIVNKLGCKKVAIFYQNDAFGEAVRQASEKVLQGMSLEPAAYGTFTRNTLDIDKGLADVVAGKPDAVVMVGT